MDRKREGVARIRGAGWVLTWLCAVGLARKGVSAQPLSRVNPSGLAVHLRIDQSGGLSIADVRHAMDQVREIWSTVGVTVTSGRYGDLANPGAATISIRLVGAPPRKANDFTVLAWVIPGDSGTSHRDVRFGFRNRPAAIFG